MQFYDKIIMKNLYEPMAFQETTKVILITIVRIIEIIRTFKDTSEKEKGII